MNPSNNAGMELPPPVGEQGIAPADMPQEVKQTPLEQSPTPSYETLANPSGTAFSGSVPPPPPPVVPIPDGQVQQTSAYSTDDAQAAASALAEDKDVIEKEWVNKAKAIVGKTKEDPYKQSEELTLLKADYLQKRYNKTLKLSN